MQKALYDFGIDLGLLFQVQDDIIDATQSSEEAGKPTGNDEEKNSFITLLSLEGALAYAEGLAETLEERFSAFDEPIQKALRSLMDRYLYRHRIMSRT